MEWIPRNPTPPPDSLNDWADNLGVTPRLARLLWMRGITDLRGMDVFLSPGLKHLAPLDRWPGLEQAAAVLAEGLQRGELLAVWGDYDVDGLTATALVKDFLASRGMEALHHIPDRFAEGYGLNRAGVEALAARGVKMLLTVDCGIASLDAVERAKELGMAVVVTDHHLPGDELPAADAICNPRLAQCPCPDLAGVGVAFLLMAAVNRLLPGDPLDIRRYLDLVALGTLADVVKLNGENRILTKNGLLLLAEAARPGVAALKEAAGFAPKAALGAGQVVFSLVPRINAAGRMGQAQTALDLLLAPDLETAQPLAAELERLNGLRRREEDAILEEALRQAEEHLSRLGLVLYGPHWHAGVIGIVASRVVEEHYRPTLILCDDGERLKGSGRSIREFDLHAGLLACSDVLLGFGGHRQAAGLSLSPDNLEPLRKRFHQAVAAQLGDAPLTPSLPVDGEMGLQAVDYGLLKELDLLQPYGPGNPEPVFVSPPLNVRRVSFFGNGHVKLELHDQAAGVTLRGKAWRQADSFPPDAAGKTIQTAFSPKLDTYNGVASIDLTIKDWRFLA